MLGSSVQPGTGLFRALRNAVLPPTNQTKPLLYRRESMLMGNKAMDGAGVMGGTGTSHLLCL